MENIWKNPYVSLILFVLIIVAFATIYNFFPQTSGIALIIIAVIVLAYIVSGNFKQAWSWLKYLLLAFLIGIILAFAHIDWFPWGIPLYILGVFILNLQEGKNKANNSAPPQTLNESAQTSEDKYALLYQIIDQKYVLEAIQQWKDTGILYTDTAKQLENFKKRTGVDPANNNQFIKLSLDEMRESHKIYTQFSNLTHLVNTSDAQIAVYDEINSKLQQGMSTGSAKKLLDTRMKAVRQYQVDGNFAIAHAEVIREEMIELRELSEQNPRAHTKKIADMLVPPKDENTQDLLAMRALQKVRNNEERAGIPFQGFENVESAPPALWKIADKETVAKALLSIKLLRKTLDELILKQEEFTKRTGKDTNDRLELNVDERRASFKLQDEINSYKHDLYFTEEYLRILGEVNQELSVGISTEYAHKHFDQALIEWTQKKHDMEPALAVGEAISEILVGLGSANDNINTGDLIKLSFIKLVQLRNKKNLTNDEIEHAMQEVKDQVNTFYNKAKPDTDPYPVK